MYGRIVRCHEIEREAGAVFIEAVELLVSPVTLECTTPPLRQQQRNDHRTVGEGGGREAAVVVDSDRSDSIPKRRIDTDL